MNQEEKYTKTIRVRINPELLEHVKKEAQKLDTDVSTYVRWCIRTGLYLDDLNKFIQARSEESRENDET
jgi:predicted HicB family RNase H-like nuclease